MHQTYETATSNSPRPFADLHEALRQEEARLGEMHAQGQSSRLTPYREGQAVLRVRASGVYQVAPGPFASAEAYVAARLDLSERTLERRVALVEAFEEARYLALLRQGVALTTLERLALAPEEIREPLLVLALEVQDDQAVVDALRAWRAQEKKEAEARSPEGVAKLLLSAAQQSLLERVTSAQERRARKGEESERRHSERSGAAPQQERLREERAALEQQRKEQAALAQQLKEQQTALAQQALRLEEQQAALRAEAQRLERLAQQEGRPVGAGEAEELQRLQRALAVAEALRGEAEARATAVEALRGEAEARATAVEAQIAALRAQAAAAPADRPAPDALEQKAAALWEQEQRQARRDVELRERAAALDARAAELAEISEALRALGQKARNDELHLMDERQTQMDIREELNQRDQILAALAVMSGGSSRRWSAPPRSLGGVLIYLADALDNAYMAAGYLLRENVETFGERLKPGEMGLALELNHQLQRAEGMINALGRKLVEDFHGVHPRLATQELEAFEQAKAKAKESGGRALPGAAGVIGLPKQPRLQEGFAVPVKLLLGTSRSYVRERGLLGTTLDTGEGVLLALSRPQTILVSGQPGSGKTHLLLVIIEMMLRAITNISTLETPALVVWFHLGLSSNDYPADLGPATGPNRGAESVAALHKLGAQPTGLPGRRVIFVPPNQSVEALKQRQREYPGAEIRVIRLAQADRFPGYLRVLLGLENNPSSYLRWLDQAAAELGDQASPEALVRAIDANKRLNQKTRASALAEVKRAAAWHVPEDRPQVSLWADLDGAHVIVDMRSDNLSSRDALGVVMTLLGSLSQRRGADKDFLPAVAVLDEFNKIVAHGDLSMVALSQMTEVRHRKTWTFASGQLPDQFPPEMSNLSSGSICGQTEGAASYEALCAMRPTLRKISRETFAKLRKGEVVVCFRDASDEKYRGEPLLVKIRPACAQPGGQTRYNSTEAEGED